MRVSGFKNYFAGLGIICLATYFTGCVDQNFDTPPAGGVDPGLTPTLTIAELKAMHTIGNYEQITTDEIIRAIVVSDDEEGNFFRQLVIQDATGGIEMRIDATDLFTQYPPGRQVYVMLKDLWLGDYNGLTQIGGAVTGTGSSTELVRIPESLLSRIIAKGTFGNTVVPKEPPLDVLPDSLISTLVRFNNVQFVQPNAGIPYADAVNLITTNLEIEDCDKNRLIVRTSGYATFAATLTPEGKGSITGVLGVYGTDRQLFIRDLDDVDMTGERCQPGGGNIISIRSLRDAYAGGSGTAPQGAIRGVVTSDRTVNNTDSKNIYFQDSTAGILVRFDADHSFNLGDELVIDVSDQELSEYNGLLQANSVPLGNAESVGQQPLPAPHVATVNEILVNASVWESSRVKILHATLGAGIFSGSVTVADSSGTMILYTSSNASFAGANVPQGDVNITAILSDYNAPQLFINGPGDISGGGVTTVDTLFERFDAFGNDQDIALPGWLNVAVAGTRIWRSKVFNTDIYAQATAYNDPEPDMETWLITPAIDVSKPKWLSFITAKAYWVQDGFSVLASTDFDGTAAGITSATWTPVTATLAQESDADHAWIPSGDIDMEQFTDPVYIAFKYVGSGPGGQTTTYRVDDIRVREK